ncbi:TetR/AcrR family transcriptional regulator [Streptomyces olivoreticuli]|uniref:TetR/AcrR family transcriptional regulator n=1 Tax=Streptomyces olivoreticuli TaxID=68246 RepID=UPI000E22FC85|nr:TetR/AcrR family transcriptional regulator [Streptomyces olivoreticuli]
MASSSRTDSPQASVWLAGKPVPKRKGEAEGGALDLERIVAATIRLLDAEGLAKFSMRRLAAELGVTAMSVYWYVDTKDDLLEIVLDGINGAMVVPDVSDEDADWRDQLRLLALEYRKMLSAHSWVTQLLSRYLNVGPRSMVFSNACLVVVRRSGVGEERITGALSAVFQFVYGFCTVQGIFEERARASGLSEDAYFKQIMAQIAVRDDFKESFKEAADLVESQGGLTLTERRERDFAYALETVIAGIEAMRDR